MPLAITAAGVERGAAVRDQARSELFEPREAHEGDERARGRAASAAKSSGPWPFTIVTCDETPAVRDRDPGGGGHGRERRDAGHDLERHAGLDERERLLAAAAEQERVAALEPDDVEAATGEPHEQAVDLLLRQRVAGDAERVGGRLVDELRRDQPVVDERVAAAQRARARAP